MFNIGLSELVIILLVAFLVVGPKDLPKVARALARGLKKIRGLIGELKEEAHWNEVVDQVKDVRGEVDRAVKEADVTRDVRASLKEVKDTGAALKKAAKGDLKGAVDGVNDLKKSLRAATADVNAALDKADGIAPSADPKKP